MSVHVYTAINPWSLLLRSHINTDINLGSDFPVYRYVKVTLFKPGEV